MSFVKLFPHETSASFIFVGGFNVEPAAITTSYIPTYIGFQQRRLRETLVTSTDTREAADEPDPGGHLSVSPAPLT